MSRIAFLPTGFSDQENPLDGDLRCFFHEDMPLFFNSPSDQVEMGFLEAYKYAWRGFVLSITRNLQKDGFDPVNDTTVITFNQGGPLNDEKGIICFDGIPGLATAYAHNGGFGAQRFWGPSFSESYFDGLSTLRFVDGVDTNPSPASITVFGRTRSLLQVMTDDTENTATGSINIAMTSFRTYDGIYAPGDGEPLVLPIPEGL